MNIVKGIIGGFFIDVSAYCFSSVKERYLRVDKIYF